MLSILIRPKVILSLIVLMVALSGCGSSSSSSSLGLSGTFGSGGSASLYYKLKSILFASFMVDREISLEDLSGTIACTTLSSSPQTFSGTADSSGNFSITGIPSGVALRCLFTDANNKVYTIVYTDASNVTMSGGSVNLDTVAPSGSSNLGTIPLDSNALKGTVDLSKVPTISTTNISGATFFDPTGTYVFQDLPSGTLPTGYSPLCASNHANNCNGPAAGETIYLNLLTGTQFTPDSTCTSALTTAKNNQTSLGSCSGTASSTPEYVVEVWQSKAARTACSNRLGYSFADAKAWGHVDLSNSGITEGSMVWSTKDTKGNAITNGWQDAAATSNWPINNCIPYTIGGQSGQKCSDNVNNTYQIMLNGGCTDSKSQPFQPSDWSKMDWTHSTCQQKNLSGALAGITQNTCTVTYNSAQTLTCVNSSGTFHQSDNSSGGTFNWNNSNLAASGALCSSIANTLQQEQCYANYFWQNFGMNSNLCLQNILTDWSATTASAFLINTGYARALKRYLLASVTYLPGNSFTMRDEQTDFRSIPQSDGTGSTFVNCKTSRVMTITGTQVSTGTYNVVFVTQTNLLDTSTACKANASTLTASQQIMGQMVLQ